MKALSLIEPWASAIMAGLKTVETRSWGTPYRGVIAIHASKSKEVIKDLLEVDDLFQGADSVMPNDWPRTVEAYPLGCLLGTVRLYHCQQMTPELIAAQTRREIGWGAWQPGRYAWSLGDVQRLREPIPCRGSLGLWEVPPEILIEVGPSVKR